MLKNLEKRLTINIQKYIEYLISIQNGDILYTQKSEHFLSTILLVELLIFFVIVLLTLLF